MGQTDGCSWAAAQLPRPCPHLWQGEGSPCLAFLAQAALGHSRLLAVTPAWAVAQGTWGLCSSRCEEQCGRAGSQAGREMLGDDRSSREEITPGTASPVRPAGLPPASPPPSSGLGRRERLPGSPTTLAFSLPFTAPEHRPLEHPPN